MVAPSTVALLGIATILGVAAIGVERTGAALDTAGGHAKRFARSTAGAGFAAAGVGMQIGHELLQAGMAEPFAVTTLFAGVLGGLGIHGVLSGLSGFQFLLIVIAMIALLAAFTGGDD